TTVNAGTLLVNGSTWMTTTVTVNAGATLGGDGTINGTVNVMGGGTLSPGVHTLTIGNLNLNSSASLVVQLNGVFVGQYTQVNVLGTVNISNAGLTVSLGAGFDPVGESFTIIINNDGVNGRFTDFSADFYTAFDGYYFSISYSGGSNGNDVVLFGV